MKHAFLWITCFLTLSGGALAQASETFDIATFKSPKGWQKQAAQSSIQFSTEDKTTGNVCLITLIKSLPSTNNSKANFDAAWRTLIKEAVDVSAAPQMSDSYNKGGWEFLVGSASYQKDFEEGYVLLFTASGYGKMVNAFVLTNTEAYQSEIAAFLESISLGKLETVGTRQTNKGVGSAAIVGSWGKSNAVSQLNNRFGTYSYNKQQYTFNADGTYYFNGKNYSEASDETLLIKESGTYTVSGSSLIITPQTSVIEAWTKRNGADNWNTLKVSQKRTLEKATYQFAIQERSLILQTARETVRDGRFSSGSTYSYGPPGTFTPIVLP